MMDTPDEIHDMNPRSWICRYRKTSVSYLVKMGIFYLVMGLALQQAGNSLAQHFIVNYQVPSVPISISLGLSSGPLEEMMFFGTLFYMSGNYLVVLAGGAIWSVLHIFNTGNLVLTNLAYGSVFFTIPHVFFSLRTWISGKGWFAILFHAVWNVIVLGLQCAQGTSCIVISGGLGFLLDMSSIVATMLLSVALYRMYKYRQAHGTI